MTVYLRTAMTKLPKSCLDCLVGDCTLPGKNTVRKVYQSKRHPDCPLRTQQEIAAGYVQILYHVGPV